MNITRRNLSNVCKAIQKLSDVNLVGRDYVSPQNLTTPEFQSIIWTALDIKHLSRRGSLKVKQIENAKILLLLDKSCIKSQIPIINASKLLNINVNTIIDHDWKSKGLLEDYGRILGSFSDVIFCKFPEQTAVEEIANGSNVPVISIASETFNLVKSLADLLTLYQHYDQFKSLTVGYIGPPGNTINTYMCILPQLKMNLKYCLLDTENYKGPSFIETARKLSQTFNTEIHDCKTVDDVVRRTDIISTVAHDYKNFEIKMKNVEEAAIKWTLLHDIPRGKCEVDKQVFFHENTLVWKSFKNLEWIYAALIIRFLTGHCHTIPEPNFDGEGIKQC